MEQSKKLYEEFQEECHIQDSIDIQAEIYEKEELISKMFGRNIKNIFSPKIRFKNRRNRHKFVKRNSKNFPF